MFHVPQRGLAGVFDRGENTEARLPARDVPDVSAPRSDTKGASSWAGRFDHVGRRVGDGLIGAPAAARHLTGRVPVRSTWTAAWFLGR